MTESFFWGEWGALRLRRDIEDLILHAQFFRRASGSKSIRIGEKRHLVIPRQGWLAEPSELRGEAAFASEKRRLRRLRLRSARASSLWSLRIGERAAPTLAERAPQLYRSAMGLVCMVIFGIPSTSIAAFSRSCRCDSGRSPNSGASNHARLLMQAVTGNSPRYTALAHPSMWANGIPL